MNGWLEFAAFAGVTAVGQFSPGPDLLLVTRTALAFLPRNKKNEYHLNYSITNLELRFHF